jgi:cytochrome c oxidase cbb3-type subunit 3
MNKDEKPSGEVFLREHEFDGIQEYDQKLPNWWLFTFYIAIVFFVFGWFAYYQLPLRIQSDAERIDGEIALIEMKKSVELNSLMASLTDNSLFEMSRDPSHLTTGQGIFDGKCAPCHGADLSAKLGGIALPGLPLNDAEWKYGSKPLEIMKIVTSGSPDITKGMIAWSTQLSPSEIAQVVAYILSHQPKEVP